LRWHNYFISLTKPKYMNIRFTAGLLLGAALGAVVVHFLGSPEGRAFINKVKEDTTDFGDTVSGLADGLVKTGKSLIGSAEDALEDGTNRIVEPGISTNPMQNLVRESLQ
jgi:hypothetical protein